MQRWGSSTAAKGANRGVTRSVRLGAHHKGISNHEDHHNRNGWARRDAERCRRRRFAAQGAAPGGGGANRQVPGGQISSWQVSGWQIPTARRDQGLTQTIVGVCFRKHLSVAWSERRNAPVFSCSRA
jgi:hypothetical protein